MANFIMPFSGLTGLCQVKCENVLLKGIKQKKCLIPTKRTKFVQAVAVPVAAPSADSAEYRRQLAESYGFRQIGEPLPDNVTLRDVIDTLPKKVLFSYSFFSCTLVSLCCST